MKSKITIDQICNGLRILEKYNPDALIIGNTAVRATIELQELEFQEISDEDRQMLFSLNWKTNGHYLWYI